MISAVILAGGASRRMGKPKLLLPWGSVSVIEQVVAEFAHAGIADIVVVTGSARQQIEAAIGKFAEAYPLRIVHNPEHARGDMLSSLQCGLRMLNRSPQVRAALIGLGDQPQVERESIEALCEAYRRHGGQLIAPSYRGRRGHPWLVARRLWGDLLALPESASPRDFLRAHEEELEYVAVNSATILADLDTPEEYHASRP